MKSFTMAWKPRNESLNETGDFKPAFIDMYYKALRNFTEKQLYLAHDECINQLKWWPKPAEVRARIPAVEEKDNSNFVIEAGHRCGSCGETERLCIDEPRGSGSWRCRPCYTGMSDLEIKGRFGELADRMEHNPA